MEKNNDAIDEMFDEMLEETARVCAKEQEDKIITEEEQEKTKSKAKNTLKNFLEYIRSARFEKKIDTLSKTYSIDKKIVKNQFISGILGRLADVLHLTLSITAEIIKYVAEFITAIIHKVVEFSYSVCTNLINLFTLNCGTIMEG